MDAAPRPPSQPRRREEALTRRPSEALAWMGALVLFWAWLTWPLWHADRWVFVRGLLHHPVGPIWIHDFVARAVADGQWPSHFTDFDYPAPVSRFAGNIPSVVEFIATAPAAWLLGWPAQWGLAEALYALYMGLGLAWLSRILGARGPGLLIAGALGVLCWPLWRDLVMSRTNAVWVSAAFATVACAGETLLAAAPTRDAAGPSVGRRLAVLGLAGLTGLLAAATLVVYPPWAALVAPLGAVALLPLLWRGGWRGVLALAVGLGLGLLLAWHDLSLLMAWTPKGRVVRCIPNYDCPWPQQVVPGSLLLRLIPGGTWSLLTYSGAALSAWALAPLALAGRRRWVSAPLLVLVAAFAWVSLGPCPVWIPGHVPEGSILDHLWRPLVPLYCELVALKDWNRPLYIAMGFAAALSGVGVDALWGRGGRWRVVGLALGVAAVAHSTWILRPELRRTENWTQAEPQVTADFLRQVPDGAAVAELPFDGSGQYLSLLEAPGHPRLNPATLDYLNTWPLPEDPALKWLSLAGRVEDGGPAPTPEALAAAGMAYIFYDPRRCGSLSDPVRARACEASLPRILTAALGEPRELSLGVLVWTLPGATE